MKTLSWGENERRSNVCRHWPSYQYVLPVPDLIPALLLSYPSHFWEDVWVRGCGDLCPFSHKSSVRSGINVGQGGLGCTQRFSSSQKYAEGMRSWLRAGHSASTTTFQTRVFMDLALCTGTLLCWNMLWFQVKISREIVDIQLLGCFQRQFREDSHRAWLSGVYNLSAIKVYWSSIP